MLEALGQQKGEACELALCACRVASGTQAGSSGPSRHLLATPAKAAAVSRPGQSLLRWAVGRPDGQALCSPCWPAPPEKPLVPGAARPQRSPPQEASGGRGGHSSPEGMFLENMKVDFSTPQLSSPSGQKPSQPPQYMINLYNRHTTRFHPAKHCAQLRGRCRVPVRGASAKWGPVVGSRPLSDMAAT